MPVSACIDRRLLRLLTDEEKGALRDRQTIRGHVFALEAEQGLEIAVDIEAGDGPWGYAEHVDELAQAGIGNALIVLLILPQLQAGQTMARGTAEVRLPAGR